ncbi:Riboflavin synthase [Lactococcus lactis]|nr:Riboflavin synthase [Lactococcus lactis]
MPESLKRSNLGELTVGSKVNLERAVALNGRFGGHIVSGHIDGTGKILSIKKEENAVWFEVQTTVDLMKYVVEKGSITIDGISLTVAQVKSKSFSVSIIPHTIKEPYCLQRRLEIKLIWRTIYWVNISKNYLLGKILLQGLPC